MDQPFLLLAIGVTTVLVAMLWLRMHPFFGLVAGALVVSLLAPGDPATKVQRVADGFGVTAAKIAIPIAAAAVIGAALVASGAADTIVRSFTRLFGIERGASALCASGFVLAIPVFFDTVFYLLLPLAKSLHRQTRKNYLLYVLAIGAGGTVTHTLVPPTPGPLYVASELGVSFGMMMLVGILVGLPVTIVGIWLAKWLDARVTLTSPPVYADDEVVADVAPQPGLMLSLLPIVLPVVAITADNVVEQCAKQWPGIEWLDRLARGLSIVGDPQLALLAATAIAAAVYAAYRRPTRDQFGHLIDDSIQSAGSIVLITAAGGAFGAMLKATGIDKELSAVTGSESALGGAMLIVLAFGVAAFMKFAQGSATVAMITTSGIMKAILGESIPPVDPVYIAMGVGTGAMVGAWMNDSGFWLFCRLSGVTASEGLKTWTPLLAIMGTLGLGVTLLYAWIMPTF